MRILTLAQVALNLNGVLVDSDSLSGNESSLVLLLHVGLLIGLRHGYEGMNER